MNQQEIKSIKFIVAGGAGFLGSHVVSLLSEKYGVKKENILIPRSSQCDLRSSEAVRSLFSSFNADIVINCATSPGGMSFYKDHPGQVFYDNLMMGVNLLEQSAKHNVKKFVMAGSALVYPDNAPLPYVEKDVWAGYPNEIEAPYGIAHRAVLAQMQAYRKEYGLDSAYLIFPNLYGPGDHFSGSPHVIPSMFIKFEKALKENGEVSFWGDGSAMREFLYVDDAAEALINAVLNYSIPDPINIGPGTEVTLKELASKIQSLFKFTGKTIWDSSMPSGRMRRCLDASRSESLLGFKPSVSIDDGLSRTYEWYISLRK